MAAPQLHWPNPGRLRTRDSHVVVGQQGLFADGVEARSAFLWGGTMELDECRRRSTRARAAEHLITLRNSRAYALYEPGEQHGLPSDINVDPHPLISHLPRAATLPGMANEVAEGSELMYNSCFVKFSPSALATAPDFFPDFHPFRLGLVTLRPVPAEEEFRVWYGEEYEPQRVQAGYKAQIPDAEWFALREKLLAELESPPPSLSKEQFSWLLLREEWDVVCGICVGDDDLSHDPKAYGGERIVVLPVPGAAWRCVAETDRLSASARMVSDVGAERRRRPGAWAVLRRADGRLEVPAEQVSDGPTMALYLASARTKKAEEEVVWRVLSKDANGFCAVPLETDAWGALDPLRQVNVEFSDLDWALVRNKHFSSTLERRLARSREGRALEVALHCLDADQKVSLHTSTLPSWPADVCLQAAAEALADELRWRTAERFQGRLRPARVASEAKSDESVALSALQKELRRQGLFATTIVAKSVLRGISLDPALRALVSPWAMEWYERFFSSPWPATGLRRGLCEVFLKSGLLSSSAVYYAQVPAGVLAFFVLDCAKLMDATLAEMGEPPKYVGALVDPEGLLAGV